MDMSKSRIEGLLAAFPKLILPGKQHTFVDTESVRYVYQPLDKLYMLLITTKASNILEDLETLRLFSKVIPEYCKTMTENDVLDNVFSLISAFDEIIALGYRENVNLSQIKTFTEMDSHEERVFQAVRQNQEREANENSKRKAKELTLARKDALKRGGNFKYPSSNVASSGLSSHTKSNIDIETVTNGNKYSQPSSFNKPPAMNKAMKLGGKLKELDQFVDKLISEGEEFTKIPRMLEDLKITNNNYNDILPPRRYSEKVSIMVEEKVAISMNKDGGVQLFDINGILMVRISDESFGRIKLYIENPLSSNTLNDHDILSQLKSPLQLQCHPNIDKKIFACDNVICLKDTSKSFPLNMDVGVVKWHLSNFQNQTQFLPLLVTCWPSEGSDGGCEVNIEFTLNKDDLELKDVSIQIPLPSACKTLLVNECTQGDYTKSLKPSSSNTLGTLTWHIPLINNRDRTGTLEFSIPDSGTGSDFFPIKVGFCSATTIFNHAGGVEDNECKSRPYFDIKVNEINKLDESDGEDTFVKFSSDYQLLVDKYEIV
ncbi:unnamed protein product [Gordionus sp. m RMFG-2023]